MVVLVDRSDAPAPTGRDVVRLVAARHFGVDAADVQIVADEGGKPALAGDAAEFAFNLSDADHLVAVAFALGVDVGVDLEPVDRTTVEPERFARRALSEAERAELAEADDATLQRGLIRWWTRKEAVLKAHGAGVRGELGGLDTSGNTARYDGRDFRIHTVEHDGWFVSVAWAQPSSR